MTTADSDVLDEIYQELLKDLNAANLRLEEAKEENTYLLSENSRLQEMIDSLL